MGRADIGESRRTQTAKAADEDDQAREVWRSDLSSVEAHAFTFGKTPRRENLFDDAKRFDAGIHFVSQTAS